MFECLIDDVTLHFALGIVLMKVECFKQAHAVNANRSSYLGAIAVVRVQKYGLKYVRRCRKSNSVILTGVCSTSPLQKI